MIDGREMYKVGEVARLLGLSDSSVRRRIVDGEIVARKIGGAIRVPRTELERLTGVS